MASLRALAHKLQTALLYNGIKIKINQMQTYSAKNEQDGDEIHGLRIST